jgi:hypothetical protein
MGRRLLREKKRPSILIRDPELRQQRREQVANSRIYCNFAVVNDVQEVVPLLHGLGLEPLLRVTGKDDLAFISEV